MASDLPAAALCPDAPTRHRRERLHFPCSAAQQRFWVLDRLEPANPALNVAVRWRLEGEVGTQHLEAAWRQIIARHEILRTSIEESDGVPVQVVEPEVDFRISCIDISALPPEEIESKADQITDIEARTPFSLAMAPLIRVTHLRLSSTVSLLLVTAHHIVCDGWSIGVLAAEMGEICAALELRRPVALPELPLHYGDFAAWQREALNGAGLRRSIAFWERSLSGLRHFELLTDRPRPPVQTSNGQIASILLDRALTERIAALARDQGCSLFMTALAALLVLLQRHSGETDIAIGTQVAGRDQVELEGLVGLFINTLVLRTDLGGDPSFLELLRRVRTSVSDAFEHRLVPLQTVIDLVRPARDLSRNPLFSVNFIFQRSFIRNASYGSFRLVDLPSRSAGAMYDLNFFMVERPEGWRASCEYNTDLFDAASVTALLERFATVLRGIVAAPDRCISALPVVTEAERRYLIHERNRTDADYPRERTVTQLFEAAVARSPNAVAVICGGRTITYAALDGAAARLGALLGGRGVSAGARIGILLERSIDLVVALLGVLKSGAAYVPLDPAYPPARLKQVIEDAGLAALVTRSGLRRHVDDGQVPLLLIDSPASPAAASAALPAALPAGPDDTAYVIYTSGSTGRPKGVQIRHRSLVNLLMSMRRQPGLDRDDTLLGVTSVSFDIAALEVFLPLIAGARLVLANDEERLDGVALLRLLRRYRVSVMQATPATWRLLIESGWRGDPPLRMLCGGEALPRALATQLLGRGRDLWNLYGPTETTIWSSALLVSPDPGPVPIGPPIANTQFYVLDAQRELAPPGAPGELYIGGDGVAAGYLGRQELTTQRFHADPFRPGEGRRIYATGDVVRIRSDGQLEFLGRNDHQIKLRGFRIELGEIEAALLDHAAVAEAVAVIGTNASGEAEIRAYVAPRERALAPAAVATALHEALSQALPAYMLPASVTILPSLPRTPNGKVDRQALPPPTAAPTGRAEPSALDPVEARLAAIWERLLERNTIAATANFFELGGNSLLAARLLARIETEFERRIGLATLFRNPTLQGLAARLRAPAEREFDFSEVVRLQPDGGRPMLIALNNTGIFYRLSRRLGPAQPFTALQLFDPALRHEPPAGDFRAVAAEYVRLIRRAVPDGPCVVMGWCIAGALAFEVAQQLTAEGRPVALVIIIDAWAPGHLRRLSPLAAWLADQSYRWQTILSDCALVLTRRQSLRRFLSRRNALRRFLAEDDDAALDPAMAAVRDGERYHEWILAQLRSAAERYDPSAYAGRVLLVRASEEPSGRFLDPSLGWAGFVSGGLDNVVISGDHSTIFELPGVQQMADCITAAIDACAAHGRLS